jgi:superfamily II DNA or RNA helicase
MNIVHERTRIIFTDYNDQEKKKIEELVATTDKVFMYEDTDNNVIALPTGMLPIISKIFPKNHIDDKSSTYWDYANITPVEHSATPRNQMQVDFINFTIDCAKKKEKVGGVLPPGAGKTMMACYCAVKLGLRTLIIAPTSNVKGQWKDTLTGMFAVPEEKVIEMNSPKDFINVKGDFVVTTQSSLAVLNKTYDLEKIMKAYKFGIKIIDEAHMFFHNTVKVDGSSNICHNWYLTGTFGRSADEENKLFQQMFGDIKIFRVPYKKATIFNRKPGDIYGQKPHMNVRMMWTHSELTDEEIKKVTSSMRYSERAGKWMRYGISIPAYTSLVIPEDGTMTEFLSKILKVIKIANKEVKYGKMLILTPTIASVKVIASYLEKLYPNTKIGTIHSLNKKAENDRVKAECEIMISTVKSSGTGFDVKDLSKLVVAEQFKSWILADQVSGRLRKRDDGKDTYMWDIVDSDIPQLRAWANVRADVLRRKSKNFKVIDI